MEERLNSLSGSSDKPESRIKAVVDLYESRKSAAEAAKVSTDMLSRYMRGDSQPGFKVIANLCSPVGVDLNWVATGTGPMRLSAQTECAGSSELEDEFALIPGYSIQVAAGDGALPGAEQATRKLAFRRKWLRFRGLNEKDLALVFAKGDSMEPTIDDNNTVMIDTNQKELRDGSIYVIRTNDHLIVKRIQTRLGKQVLLISDNKAYPPIEVSMDEANDLEVIGRVVWIGKDV